jgi:immune inhibitor A
VLHAPRDVGTARALRSTRIPVHLTFAVLALAGVWLATRRGEAVPPPVRGGPLPPEVARALSEGVAGPAPRPAVETTSRALPSSAGAATPQTIGRWNVPVLCVDFPDRRATFTAAGFQSLLFDTTGSVPTGSMADYYSEVSGGALLVRGDVFGWKTLPDTANFYSNDSYGVATLAFPQNDAGLVYATAGRFDAEIDYSRYDRNGDGYVDALLIVHSGYGGEAASGDRSNLWSLSSGLSGYWGNTGSYTTQDPRPGHPGQFMKIDRFCIVPEFSAVHPVQRSEIGVYCHEFGHALGWPDLYDASVLGGASFLGPGNWCLMSSGAYGQNSQHPERPSHPCGWALWDAGWVTLENLTQDGDRTFAPVETSRRVYRLWFQGETSNEWFLLENRQRIGFDDGLPGTGLVVYRMRSDVIAQRRSTNTINSGQIPGIRVEEADGRGDLRGSINRGDARDPFPGATGATRFADDTNPSTVTYDGLPLNLSLEAIRAQGLDVSAYVQLLPVGWGDPAPIATTGTGASMVGTAGTPLLADALGDLWLATTEGAPSSSEIVLRRKRFGVDWTAPLPLTQEPGISSSATLAMSRTGRLAVTWWDTRDGNSEIYCATGPSGGPIGPATRVTNQSAFSQLPAAAWTADGRLAVAWMDGRSGGSSIYSRVFSPSNPAGSFDRRVSVPDPSEVTANAAVPAIACAGNRVVVVWQERIGGVDEILAAVDSAGTFTFQRLLSAKDGFTSNQPALLSESDTSVWVFWRDNLPSLSLIRQARWSVTRGWNFEFSGPYASPQAADGARPAIGAGGDVHMLFQRTGPTGALELVESVRHRANQVWDAGPSRIVTFAGDIPLGTAFAIDGVGRTHVVWLAQGTGGTTLYERVRAAPSVAPVAVDPVPDLAGGVARAVAFPNPARGRVAFRFDGGPARGAGSKLHLYSVAGRRLATVDAAGAGPAVLEWSGADALGRRAAPGIVLVELVGPRGETLGRGRFVWLP